MVWLWKVGLGIAVVCTLGVAGCSGGGDDDDEEAKKPDTGYGAAQVVPATRSCNDFCARAGECAAALCDEDTKSTRYDALQDLLASACDAQCSDSVLQSNVTAENWQCLFQSSCRQAFDYDTCHTQASYYCN
jgi:hypothetical protein